ncbi:PQQ-dependent sugar dehydrogenase [Methylocella silvestris]|uniref:Glucose dehydrogenase n=1 Tax=Methylocella silvestris TaxID=199596 RepID=A0A2J7TKA2_METSI|nr:PQQ-dependent sugar dehydrogenase [Methylocella silvestris]PNG27157.1 glucose dehydrogenase [Methylocella silvestris]
MNRRAATLSRLYAAPLAVVMIAACTPRAEAQDTGESGRKQACDTAGLSLPRGFCATIFADNIGHARQLAVAPDGTVYVNTWSGVYYKNDKPPEGGFLVAIKDKDGDGRADEIVRFGETVASGGHGGTGLALYKGAIYAEINDRIVRYALNGGAPEQEPETIVSGLPVTGDHPMHPFAIGPAGDLYVDLGSADNACEEKNRMPLSPGRSPCVELETRGGVWRYDANKRNQLFSPAERFASGLRNAEGLSVDPSGRIFATQHGRDQFAENWPRLYTPEQGQNLPAEILVELKHGADYGWPECYFDDKQEKLVLAPEYGGDGGQKIGVCAEKTPPVAFFPAHWAPNDMKIYHGAQFPAAYRGGAFIAFHGSWNRAPGPQGGYNVVFQPLSDGKASEPYVIFADGFAGAHKEPGRAEHRPSGLAVGPDGALYVSDDQGGRIWRVTFEGGPDITAIEAAPEPAAAAATAAAAEPPEGVHPDASAEAALPIPPGASPEDVALGRRIFAGEVAGATCGGCHGTDGKGTPVGADLTSGTWLWGDGSLESLITTITNGVPEPKQHGGAMPPMGGVSLSEPQIRAVAAYVWALGHAN